ncbi:hypothetical protein COCMIDRAFT_24937 [Bipolaris oryzae ATCC 44560]|uniref:Uncharacterized protein n=1 Tax=Bipolaris oryzae ATCC 44560 TaxID=930090 RepID=W6ZIH0_COCMI|nr:uncharacterized protein COCMIDRAFT_24937 [Bipolaris oryzae ATCC 44560]EUC47169.1 hypothetical protein COCMIDRAFT_24937 [Bipolaris oryzae ATCC 44560]
MQDCRLAQKSSGHRVGPTHISSVQRILVMKQRQQKHVTYVSCCETCRHAFTIGPAFMRVQFPKFTVRLGDSATMWSSLSRRAMRRSASKPPYDVFQKRKPQARGQVSLPVSSTPFYSAEPV